MITLTGQITGVDGSPGYVYALQGGDENCTTVAEKLIAYADSRFQFQGRIGTRTEVIEPNMIDGVLKSGGQVAANCSYNGVSVNILFQSPTQVCLLPANGAQAIADDFIGANLGGGGGYNDFDDPYADFDTSPAGGLAMSTPPDPRAGSRQPRGGYPDPNFDDAMPQDQAGGDKDQTVGIGEWILTFILLAIPIVNLVMLIIWLAGKKTKKSKKNFLIAELILFLIGALLSAGSIFLFGNQIAPILQQAGFNVSGITASNSSSGSSSKSSNSSSNKNVIENISGNESSSNSNSKNSNKNTSSDLFSNTSTSNTNHADLEENTPPEEQEEVPALAVNINKVDFKVYDDDALAIFTVTGYNEGTEEVIPSDALRLQANQGVTPLEQAIDATVDFAPASLDEPIAANGSGVFQFAFHLAKDDQGGFNQQKVHVVVQNEYTLAQLAEGEY